MLLEISIKNFAIIESISLNFEQGMTVFSDQIFSCIADDNSILMVLRSEETAKDIFEQVKNW